MIMMHDKMQIIFLNTLRVTPGTPSPSRPHHHLPHGLLSLPVVSSCRTETGKVISRFTGDRRPRQAHCHQLHPSRASSLAEPRADAVSRPDPLCAFGSRSDGLDPPDPGQYQSTLSRFVHEPHYFMKINL